MSPDKLNRKTETIEGDDEDYRKWADLHYKLNSLGAQAAAGNKAALSELIDAGSAMRAEMDRLMRKRREKNESATQPYDDIHVQTD